VFALLLFAAISSQAAIVYKNFSQPVDFEDFLPCTNGRQGEIIHFTGSMQTTLVATFENGWVIGHFHIQPKITGLGEMTGITYQVVGSESLTEKVSPAKVVRGVDAHNFGIIGDGGNYHLHENYNFVSTDNGEFESFGHDNFFVFCQ